MLKALKKAESKNKGISAFKDMKKHQKREWVSRQGNEEKNIGRKKQDPKSLFSKGEGIDSGSHLLP
jgi:hypothetical protein